MVAYVAEHSPVRAAGGRNGEVRALRSTPRINERCLELRGAPSKKRKGKMGKAATSGGCEYLRGRRDAVRQLRELALAEPTDVEELAKEGAKSNACARRGGAHHLLLLPYNVLLQAEMREALGVRLDGAVVVVDATRTTIRSVRRQPKNRSSSSPPGRATSGWTGGCAPPESSASSRPGTPWMGS